MCKACRKRKWYARQVAQQLRDEIEHNEDLTQSERDARRLAQYYLDRVFEDWPGKYVGMQQGS